MSNVKSDQEPSHSILPRLPETVEVKRSDPVYMAHAYLTKVPVPGILPFVEAFPAPGDVVLDPFAGSGMTGVASLAAGRNARLFDVSVLGRHIGRNYTRLVDSTSLREAGHDVIGRAVETVGDVYAVRCAACESVAQLAKTVWSMVMECGSCGTAVNYYHSLEKAGWKKPSMQCTSCGESFSSKARRVDEEPVVDSVKCSCSKTQIEQAWQHPLNEPNDDGLTWPDVEIDETRQMYVASALGRHGLTTTSSFYSPRNVRALAALLKAIDEVAGEGIREKLRFCFTAVLTRASKRYQWSKKRPLNAANANYYVAPVFYEWNVFDLFERKVEAAIKSDNWIRGLRGERTLFEPEELTVASYETASAADLPLDDNSIDYVFTDPPFGSNIFYSDMNLFQEAWLGEVTNDRLEAVIDRVDTGEYRSAERYEDLLTESLRECRRVLKPGSYLTMVFGNSSGKIWQLVQRAIADAGFVVVPELISVLNKGQRSVKGLASGFENVVTLDLMLTMTEGSPRPAYELRSPSGAEIEAIVTEQVASGCTPSHLHLEVLRHGFRNNWDLSLLSLPAISALLADLDREVDARTGAVL